MGLQHLHDITLSQFYFRHAVSPTNYEQCQYSLKKIELEDMSLIFWRSCEEADMNRRTEVSSNKIAQDLRRSLSPRLGDGIWIQDH